MIESSANPAAVFESYGLSSKGGWGSVRVRVNTNGVGIGEELCSALQRLGGIYSAFGRFLGWRSDLLDASCISGLRSIRVDFPAIPISHVEAVVRRELGQAGGSLAAGLAGPPLWNTLARTAYLSKHQNHPVIVQVARNPIPDERFAELEKGLRALRCPEAAAIVTPAVLKQFHTWIRNGESLTRERSFLDILNQHGGETLTGYPVPIPELSTSAVLCWYPPEGRPALEMINRGDNGVPVLIASAVLEQFYSLGMVDADLDLDAMIVDQNHRLHYRRLSNPVSVLPSVVNNGIRYASAVLAGNASLSAQTLIRLMISHPPLDLETSLIDEFSGVEPELKINMWFPPSADAFESNWRALAKLFVSRPLFLDSLHRNLVAVGYWTSDSVGAGAPRIDAISEAQWPVVGRLIRTQFGMLLNRESAVEWAFGSGLLMFGTLREMNRLAEEIRDNDLTVGVDVTEPVRGASPGRTMSSGIVLGSLFLGLLMSLLWGGKAPEPWHMLLRVLAVGALPAMFWAVSRIG